MFIIKSIRNGYVFVIPTIVSGLLPTDRQNSASAWIEGIEHTVRSASVLNAQFTHVAMP